MNYAAVIKAANDLTNALPFLGSSPSRQDYEDALALVEYLVEHEPDSPLVEMLTAKIDQYENESRSLQILTRVLPAFRQALRYCER